MMVADIRAQIRECCRWRHCLQQAPVSAGRKIENNERVKNRTRALLAIPNSFRHSEIRAARYAPVCPLEALYVCQDMQKQFNKHLLDKIKNDCLHFAFSDPMHSYSQERYNMGRCPSIHAKVKKSRIRLEISLEKNCNYNNAPVKSLQDFHG